MKRVLIAFGLLGWLIVAAVLCAAAHAQMAPAPQIAIPGQGPIAIPGRSALDDAVERAKCAAFNAEGNFHLLRAQQQEARAILAEAKVKELEAKILELQPKTPEVEPPT